MGILENSQTNRISTDEVHKIISRLTGYWASDYTIIEERAVKLGYDKYEFKTAVYKRINF